VVLDPKLALYTKTIQCNTIKPVSSGKSTAIIEGLGTKTETLHGPEMCLSVATEGVVGGEASGRRLGRDVANVDSV